MLETSLVDSASKRDRSKLALLPISVASHVVLLGAALFANVWWVDLPEAGPHQISVYRVGSSPAVPPPAPPPPAGPAKPAASTPKPVLSKEPTVPTEVPPDTTELTPIPAGEEMTSGSNEPGGQPGGEIGGVPGGEIGGTPGGEVGGMPGGEIGGGGTGPLPVGGDVKAPVTIRRVEPAYPQLARKIGVQGVVVLECTIDRFGFVRDSRVVRSPHPLLAESAIQAVTQWKFKPGTLNGQPVDVIFHLTVNFSIQR